MVGTEMCLPEVGQNKIRVAWAGRLRTVRERGPSTLPSAASHTTSMGLVV